VTTTRVEQPHGAIGELTPALHPWSHGHPEAHGDSLGMRGIRGPSGQAPAATGIEPERARIPRKARLSPPRTRRSSQRRSTAVRVSRLPPRPRTHDREGLTGINRRDGATALTQTPPLLSGERRIRCLPDFGKGQRMRRTKAITRRLRPGRALRHGLRSLAGPAGRLHRPDDPQAGPHEAPGSRRTAALIGLETARSPRAQQSRCAQRDGRIARMMRKPNPTTLTAAVALRFDQA